MRLVLWLHEWTDLLYVKQYRPNVKSNDVYETCGSPLGVWTVDGKSLGIRVPGLNAVLCIT